MPYSFVPPGQGHFGSTLGGYGSLGIGQGLVNALGTGLNLAQAFRRYQNDNMLDQFRIPAQEAEANNAMMQNDFNAMQALVAKNQIQPYLATGARPGQIYDQSGALISQPSGSPVQPMQMRNMSPQDMGQTAVGQQLQNTNAIVPPGQQEGMWFGQHLVYPQTPAQRFDPRYLMR